MYKELGRWWSTREQYSHSSSGRSKGCRRADPSSWSEAEDDCVWKSTVLTFSPLSWDLHELVARPLRISHPRLVDPSRTSLPSYSPHWHAFLTGSSTDATFLCPDYFSELSFCAAAPLQVSGLRFQELRLLIFEQHKRFSAHLRGFVGSNPGKVNKFGQMKIWLSNYLAEP